MGIQSNAASLLDCKTATGDKELGIRVRILIEFIHQGIMEYGGLLFESDTLNLNERKCLRILIPVAESVKDQAIFSGGGDDFAAGTKEIYIHHTEIVVRIYLNVIAIPLGDRAPVGRLGNDDRGRLIGHYRSRYLGNPFVSRFVQGRYFDRYRYLLLNCFGCETYFLHTPRCLCIPDRRLIKIKRSFRHTQIIGKTRLNFILRVLHYLLAGVRIDNSYCRREIIGYDCDCD